MYPTAGIRTHATLNIVSGRRRRLRAGCVRANNNNFPGYFRLYIFTALSSVLPVSSTIE